MDKIKPLDLVFFKGDGIFSQTIVAIEYLTTGNQLFSHVGLVINKKLIPNLNVEDEDKLYIWESGNSIGTNEYDVESGRKRLGVQVIDLEKRIASYNGKISIAHGKLANNPFEDKDKLQELQKKMCEIHINYSGLAYPLNPFEILSTIIPCLHCCDSKKYMLCSEFIGYVYQDIGIFDTRIRTNELLPVNFVSIESWTKYNRQFIQNPILSELNFLN